MRLLLLFCFALPLGAQTPVTITNPSFEAPQALTNPSPLGAWEYGIIPGWTVTGLAGLWQPNNFASLPDGVMVAFSNGGSIAQDSGVLAQPNTTYTLSVYVGHRADNYPNTYTISLNIGTAVCSSSTASNFLIPLGTFQKQTLTCNSAQLAGNVNIVLSAAGGQVDFDNVTLSAKTTQPISLIVKAQLLWCALCDQTDDVAAAGSLVIAQTNGPTGTYVIRTDGSISASGIIDIAQDPLEFTLYLIDSTGVAQPGAITKLTFPRFELSSPSFTLGTFSLGVVRIAHTTDSNGNPAVRIVSIDQFKLLGP